MGRRIRVVFVERNWFNTVPVCCSNCQIRRRPIKKFVTTEDMESTVK